MPHDQMKTKARKQRYLLRRKIEKYGPESAAEDMRGRHGKHARADKSGRWNSGILLSSHGYVKLRVGKDHALADPNGYAYEHSLVWVGAGNRPPKADEVIHHKNENKQDNRLENLEVISRNVHGVHHGKGLSDFDVLAIREMYARGKADMPRIAIHFGIPQSRVSKIIRGETRKSAGGPISTNNRGKKAAARRPCLGRVSAV